MALYNAGLFLVLFLSIIMIVLVGGRREMRGAVPMLLLLMGMSVWSLCQLLHIFVINPQLKYFWYQAKFLGIVMIPAPFVMLAADMTGRKDLIKPWHMVLLITAPALTLLSILGDPWLHLFRKTVEYVVVEQFILVKTVDGPAFWAFTVYSYGVILFSAYLLAEKALKSKGTERKQTLLMLFGSLFPWLWNILFLLILDPVYPLDYTPVLMLVTESVFLITLFYYRMFSIVPFTKRAVFDTLADLIVVIDSSGIIQDMNPAAREVFETGSNPMGLDFSQFIRHLSPVHPGDITDIQGEFQGFRQGQIRDYLAQVTAISGKSGSALGSLLVFKDITELSDSRRTLESATGELAVQNEKKMLFVRQVNRNIRIPLNRILGYAEFFGDKNMAESQKEAVEHLSLSGTHLIQLINDITDYSKIETGKMELKEEAVQFYDLIRHVCRLFEYPAEQKGIAVKCTVAGDVPVVVRADSLRMTQILSNIVGNAVKFTEKGHVSLAVRMLSGPWMEIEITDTGIGISEKNLEQLFVPYQQVVEGAALKFGGTGLGLAIVKELVERMGGSISITSELGKGTTFLLKLPCVEGKAESPIYNLEQMSDYKSKSLHIGLMTRDRVQQALIRRFFRSWPQAVCYSVEDPAADLRPDIPWDILLLHVEEFSAESVQQVLMRHAASGGDRLPALIGMTNDRDVAASQKQGYGILEDCILMPISFNGLNRILRKLILRQ